MAITFYDEGQEAPRDVQQVEEQAPVQESQQQEQIQEQAPIDYGAYIKEKFGVEETELSQRLSKVEEYERLNKELSEATPYKSDYARQIDELVSEGMDFDQAIEFMKLDIEKMDSVDKIATHLKSTVAKDLNISEIKDYILEDLGYSVDGLDAEDKDKIWSELTPSQKIKLNKLTDEANTFLAQKKENLKNNAPKRHEVLQGKENLERIKAWEQQIPNLITDKILQKIKDSEVVFELSSEEKQEVAKLTSNYVQSVGLDVSNKESLEHVQSYMQNIVRLRNFDKFLELAYNSGSSKQLDKDLQEFENPNLSRSRTATKEKGKVTFYE